MVFRGCSMILFIYSLVHSTFQMVRSPLPGLSTGASTATTKKLRFELDKYTCPANFTMCRNLYCVSVKFRCDGFDDCGDGTDEENCDAKQRISYTCTRDKFKCSFGPCISRLSLCDGVKDCPHEGEDEIGCPPKTKQNYCQRGYFQCLGVDGCIPGDWVCDGEADCNDASDERNCQRPHHRSTDSWFNFWSQSQTAPGFLSRSISTTRQPCNKFSFVCGSGDCIAEGRVCDGRRDCRDGSDEGTFCQECLIQNGGCQEFCQPKPEGATCSCRVGYRLMSDKKSCRDPRACTDGDKVCDHYCTMVGDSRMCYCSFGYETFGKDGTRCKLIISEGYLIFAAGPEIRTIELNEDHRHNLYGLMFKTKQDSRISAISYNNKKHLVYFASDNKVQYINEKSKATCVLGGFQKGIDLAIDWVTENIYYVENSPAMLGVCRWDGRYCHEFYYNRLVDVRGIALHPKRSLMFWIDHAKTMLIERADMDGSNRRVIVDHKLEEPMALTIDYVHERLYWIDAKLSLIESCDLSGSYRELALSFASKHPVDLFVFDSKIYWADSYASGIYSVPTREPNANITVVHSSPFKPNSLTVNHTAYHNLSLPNPCEVVTCSYICVIHSNEDGGIVARCLCPTGYVAHPDKPSECYPTNSLASAKIHWCYESFKKVCKNGNACYNNGTCSEATYDRASETKKIQCKCQPGFTGLYCETPIEIHLEIPGALTRQSSNDGSSAMVGVMLTVLVLCLVFLGIFAIRKWDMIEVGKQILQFPLSLLRRRRMTSQRDQFFKGDLKPTRLASPCERSCSFSNPVYDQAANYDDASIVHKSPIQFMTAYHNNRYESPKQLNDSGLYGSSGSSSPSTF